MIIDLHTHLLRRDTDLAPALLEDMVRCGVDLAMWDYTEAEYLCATEAADRCVVFGLRAQKTGWHAPNAVVADFVRRHPGKYVYFASIDPAEPDCMEQLRHEHVAGARGVKLGPVYQGVHPLDARYGPIYAFCQREGLPIITHMATTFASGVPLEYARPVHMDEVACRYPQLRIVLAHLGHPWSGEALSIIRKQPNVFADLSALYYRPWQFYQTMLLAAEYGCEQKIFFGSDFPATTTADSLAGIRRVNDVVRGTGLPLVPEVLIEDIIHRDSLAMLGIDP